MSLTINKAVCGELLLTGRIAASHIHRCPPGSVGHRSCSALPSSHRHPALASRKQSSKSGKGAALMWCLSGSFASLWHALSLADMRTEARRGEKPRHTAQHHCQDLGTKRNQNPTCVTAQLRANASSLRALFIKHITRYFVPPCCTQSRHSVGNGALGRARL